jgi:hypothetical protein
MAKKKAAEKNKNTGTGGIGRWVIVMKDGALPEPKDLKASKSGPSGSPDRVRWDNQSSRGRTVLFDFGWWPFEEPPSAIQVKTRGRTGWFTISTTTPSSGYSYKVYPSLVAGVPPDDPKISVSD